MATILRNRLLVLEYFHQVYGNVCKAMNKTRDTKKETLYALVREVASSKNSDFYRRIWGKDIGRKVAFEDLTFSEPEHFIATMLRDRTYKKEKGLTKVVRAYGSPFLVQWGLSDLSLENYGNTESQRPFVMLSDNHETLEKALWFYGQDVLPLAGEIKNLSVALSLARSYKADSVVTDGKVLPELLRILTENVLGKLSSVTLVDRQFGLENIATLIGIVEKIKIILALPETGAFAEHCEHLLSSGVLLFHEDANSFIELHNGEIVVSKLSMLVTPIIRYKTNIRASISNLPCPCGNDGFTLL